MSNKTKIILPAILITVSLSISILIFLKIDSGEKPKENAGIKKTAPSPAIDTALLSYDLYYLKHPFLNRGDQLNDEGNYDSAIYYYREASAKFEKELQWDNYVWINGYIGRLYLYAANMNFRDALPYLQKAYEKGKQHLDSAHPFMAITCYYWGLYYYYEGMAGKSLEMHNKALEILLMNYKKDNVYTADVYYALGNLYTNLMFDNVLGEKHYLKSVKIRESLPGDKNKAMLTSGYGDLARLNLLIGDYEKAQSFCYEAIRNVPYVRHHGSYWMEVLEGILGNIYSSQQNYDKAIARLKNAIRINHDNSGDRSYLSYYQSSIGDIYSKKLQYDSSIIYYKKALLLTLSRTLLNDQQQQAAATSYSLGMAYLKLKLYSSAHFYLNKCLAVQLKIYGDKHWQTAVAFQGIGNIYREEGLPDSALKYFGSAVRASTKKAYDTSVFAFPLASEINNTFHSYPIIKDKASVLKQLYFKHPSDERLLYTSLAYYCLADTMMTIFRSEYDRETAKLVFSKNNNMIYEEAIDCAALLYQKTKSARYLELIFNFIDKRKSGLLLEALNEKELLERAGIPVQEQDELRSLQKDLSFLQSQLEKQNQENADESILQMLLSRIRITESKFKELHEKLINNYPFYASIQYKNDTTSLSDVQASSGRNNFVVVEYFWGDKAVYVLGIYKNKSQLFKISRCNELAKSIDTIRANFINGYAFATKQNDFLSFQHNAFNLYNLLIAPTLTSFNLEAGEKEGRPGIVIIPDGPLSYIPVEALITTPAVEEEVNYQKLNYLINRFDISYSYSNRHLLKNYNRQNMLRDPTVLALSFSKDKESGVTRKYDDGELLGSARELKGIAQYMKGQFYKGADATEYVFKKEAPFYDILHLAIHGEADSLNSYNSKLIFRRGNDSVNDGNLYAYEIYNLPVKAKLAVLSACESGIGKLNYGEGMFSMARGFVYAGCPSVIMSYWRVNDNATESIITGFYKQISQGDKIDHSLRKSKLEYINRADRRTAHPSNWAAFVAIGNMTPLVKKKSQDKAIILIAVIIAIGISIFLIKRNYKLPA